MIEKAVALVQASRPYNSASGVLLFSIGYFFSPAKITTDFLVAIVIILLAYAYATFQNDLEDIAIDTVNTPNKALLTGVIKPVEMRAVSQVILILLLALSLSHFPHHLFFVITILLLTWAYNKPPLRFSHKPLASIITLSLLYSTVTISYGYWLNPSRIPLHPLALIIIGWFLIRFSIACLKDFKDAKGDALYNKQTFYLTFGKKITVYTSLVLYLIGTTCVLIALQLHAVSGWPVVVLLSIFLYLTYERTKLFALTATKDLSTYFHRIFFRQNLFDLIYLSCLIYFTS